MALPEKIKVCGAEYTISCNSAKDEYLNAAAILGECNYSTLAIAVKSTPHETRKAQLLIHELCHAILFATGLETNDIYNDENLIRPLANALWQVLKDNDFNWLREVANNEKMA